MILELLSSHQIVASWWIYKALVACLSLMVYMHDGSIQQIYSCTDQLFITRVVQKLVLYWLKYSMVSFYWSNVWMVFDQSNFPTGTQDWCLDYLKIFTQSNIEDCATNVCHIWVIWRFDLGISQVLFIFRLETNFPEKMHACMHAYQRMANNLRNQLSNMCLIIYHQHDSLSCACKVCLIYLLKYQADKLLLCVKLLCKTVIIHIMHLQFHLP